MKINLILARILFVIGIAPYFRGDAQTIQKQFNEPSTNVYSLDPHDIRDETWQEYDYYVHALLNHVAVPEVLPASQDTNDLWGSMTNGFRLSIRFRKGEYDAKGVVPAISILRNLEVNSQTLLLTNSRCLYLTFTVRYETNGFLAERSEERKFPKIAYSDGSSIPVTPHELMSWKWEGRSEKEFALNLNRIFDLSRPGRYSVQAICWVYSPLTQSPIYKISSGVASFRIVENLPLAVK